MHVVSLAAVAGLVAGCATAGDEADVKAAAADFLQAVRDADGERACADLVPQAQSGLETGDSRCAEEILKLGLKTGSLRKTEIWGDRARVQADGDTIFLTRWATAWKVTAAGCTPRSGRPYECEVEA
jgi:hypothetical protein